MNEENKDIFDVITNNHTIEIVISLLQNVDWDIINRIIESTPPDLKEQENYKVLVESLEFKSKLDKIFKS